MRELLSNGKRYTVPPYQRSYSWTEEQWDDLWHDILEAERTGRPHYMGAIVLVEREHDHFTVIDGQQRLATISLIAVAGMFLLQETGKWDGGSGEDSRLVELLRNAFVGTVTPRTKVTEPKLTLNDQNQHFYSAVLLRLRQPISVSGLPRPERLLWDAMCFFKSRLEEKFQSPKDSEALADFIYSGVATHLRFIRVEVDDDLSAYTIFETLNARGIDLTPGDLLKNYLFSLVHSEGESSQIHAEQTWNSILSRVDSRKLPEVLRHYFCSIREPRVRLERMYRTVRESVKASDQVIPLLENLDDAALVCEALEDSSHGAWDDIPDSARHVANLIMYSVSQYRPVVLAAWRMLPRGELAKVLRACDIVSFRYNVIAQRNTNRLEDVYNEVAVRIHRGELASANSVKSALGQIYVSDDEFREAFAKVSIPAGGSRSKLVRHILCELERQEFKASLDAGGLRLTVEHILPLRQAGEWHSRFSAGNHERYVHRLGNYLLLEPRLNSQVASNADLAAKVGAYADSSVESTRSFQYAEWTPEHIEGRQKHMAKLATSIWRLDGV